jgi:hypothetical protein
VLRTVAAAGPSEEVDSSSAGIDIVILEIEEVSFVVVKSISTTRSLPPKVNRLVCKSVVVSSEYTRSLTDQLYQKKIVPELFYQSSYTLLSKS